MRYASVALLLLASVSSRSEGTMKTPVLVELFTSEGCSSCPPADAVLARLEKDQPVAGAMTIVISEHVDYWDRLGWRDPFSNPLFSQRQEKYAQRLTKSGPYTPQMVVDGKTEFVGSETQTALSAIAASAKRPKTAIRLSSAKRQANEWTVHVEIDSAPAASELLIALVDPVASTQVMRGENGGRNLKHVAVARSLTSAATISAAGAFSKEIVVKTTSPGQRVVAFLQAKGQGEVLGSALLN